MKDEPAQVVQSLTRSLDIIEKLVDAGSSLGVTELSKSLGLHKSTVYRLLSTLVYRGYVEQDRHGRYKIGLKLFEIGGIVLNNMGLRKRIKPYLERLREETKETIHLGIMDNHEVVYIDKEETSETIRMYSEVGRRVDAHCTSLGKVLLAYANKELPQEILENNLKKYTGNTITDKNELIEHLYKVKGQGYAVDNQEQEEGIRCIGGPIFDYKGDVIAAFSIAGPATRMTEDRVLKLVAKVKDYSNRISSSFGYKID